MQRFQADGQADTAEKDHVDKAHDQGDQGHVDTEYGDGAQALEHSQDFRATFRSKR